MLSIELASLEQTRQFGEQLANILRQGTCLRTLLLRGELGSGKTTLVRELVCALPGGEHAEVASPSFTLCNMYATTPPVLHCDIYRSPASLPDDIWEALDNTATSPQIILIEWAEYLPDAALPAEYLDIHLDICNQKRLVTVTPYGDAAVKAVTQLQHNNWAL